MLIIYICYSYRGVQAQLFFRTVHCLLHYLLATLLKRSRIDSNFIIYIIFNWLKILQIAWPLTTHLCFLQRNEPYFIFTEKDVLINFFFKQFSVNDTMQRTKDAGNEFFSLHIRDS